MPRLNTRKEFFDKLKKVELIRPGSGGGFGTTTLSAAEATGQTVISLTSATNFATGDTVIVGEGDKMEVHNQEGAPATNDITLRSALAFDHDAGEKVVEGQKINLGHIHESGVTPSFAGDFVQVKSAIRHMTVNYMLGYVEMMVSFGLLGFSMENFALALGIPETAILGAGTAASPYSFNLTGDNLMTDGDRAIRLTGLRKDLTNVEIDICGVEIDFTAMQIVMQRGTVTQIPVVAKSTSCVLMRQWL